MLNYFTALEAEHTDQEVTDVVTDIYDANINTLVGKYNGAQNLGDALNLLFTELNNTNDFSDKYLASIGKSMDDVKKYNNFR